MLYYLFDFLEQFNIPGTGVFHYISFRSGVALMTSLIISILFGNRLINLLRKMQMGEQVRDLGLEGQKAKEGTPTMGGLIILGAILIPTLLFAKLHNIYIIMMIIATIWLGFIGFLDDYLKMKKRNKDGLSGKFKVIGQIGVGIIVGAIMFFHPDVKIYKEVSPTYELKSGETWVSSADDAALPNHKRWVASDDMVTTIPFVKDNEIDYNWAFGEHGKKWGWILFIPIVIFIVTAVSNGANLTDGLDGLATGTSAIIGLALSILAYVSAHIQFADYLDVMYIPGVEELVVYISAFVGACIGFLWFNSYPAKVFMGDTGSLAIGGIIAVFAIAIRKELLIPVLCGIFLLENLSVILQVGYFKFTKRRTGEGKRVFLMAPLHHHYQKKGLHEAKIVARFWIVGILLAVLSIVTLKLR